MKLCLIVEDDTHIREILKMIIETQCNMVCHAASSVKEALTFLKTFRYEIVIVDYILENEYGDKVFEAVRQLSPVPGLVLMTAASNLEQIAASLDAKYFLAKPFGLDDLHKVIENFDDCRGA